MNLASPRRRGVCRNGKWRGALRFVVVLEFWLVLIVPATALAQSPQPWISDRRFVGGPGTRKGNVELHPSVAAEVGYDSNFYQGAGFEPEWNVSEPIVPTARLRLTPSLTMNSLGAYRRLESSRAAALPKMNFRASLAAQLSRQFSLDPDYTDNANRSLVGGDAGLNLDISPGRPWGSQINLKLSRIVQPNNNPGLSGYAFDRTIGGGDFALRWTPGGGVLSWSAGYGATATIFDQKEYGLDRVDHGFSTDGRWRFLPRTALIYSGEVGFISYLQPGTRQRSANFVGSQLGLNGLITARFGLLAMVGWKAMFYDADVRGNVDDFDGPVGRLELTWFLGGAPDKAADGRTAVGLSSVRVGLERDVTNSGIANYYESNQLYADLAYFVGGVLALNLQAGLALVAHPVPRDDVGRPLTVDGRGMVEVRPSSTLYAQYRITQSWAALANLGFNASPNNNRVLIDRARQVRDNLKYYRFSSFVGVRWYL